MSQLFCFKDEKPVPDSVYEYTETIKSSSRPVVIDNGSYQCRAGFAGLERPQLIFKNITAKQRGKKESSGGGEMQVGNGMSGSEMLRWTVRSQFDKNIVTQFDIQEVVFDHIFSHLGINTDGSVDHPVVMTEPVCNPNQCRQQMSELLFECYHVPRVSYGIDAMFSLYNNHAQPHLANGVIIAPGYQSTHILPVLNGRMDSSGVRRINIGGAHLEFYMQRLLQLKYPGHLVSLLTSRIIELLHDHTHTPVDYIAELDLWAALEYYEKNVHKIQLPYSQAAAAQFSAEKQKERREQQIRRLKELNVQKCQEKLKADEDTLQKLLRVQEFLEEDEDEEEFTKALEELDYQTVEEFEDDITKLTTNIQRLKQKLSPGDEKVAEIQESKSAPVYELLDIPDDQLSNDEIIMKKRQKILKAAREGRDRAKAQQRAKSEKEKEEKQILEQKRLTNFPAWLFEIRQRHQTLVDKKTIRKQKRSDMSKRRTFASQQRMKLLTKLAEAEKKHKKTKADTFGQDDADWDIYKDINKDGGDSDGEEAEDEQIEELETMLREHDPEFQRDIDGASPLREIDIAEYYRLHVAVEQIRVPELLFQPSMIGADQAGITETLQFVFGKYSPAQQNIMAQNVYLTGGPAARSGFQQRIQHDLLEMRPFQSTFRVRTARNPILDSWYGASRWAMSPVSTCGITRDQYMECGGDYLIEHCSSNNYVPNPVLVCR